MPLKTILSKFNLGISLSEKEFKQWIKRTTGFPAKNLNLYYQALAHSSSAGIGLNNERLEFLGDAVLSTVVAEYIFKIYPTKKEGFLTQLRSKIVNGTQLKTLALKFGFEKFFKSTLSESDKIKSTAYGDAFEAFIGALFLDLGYDRAKTFIVNKILKIHIDINELSKIDEDYKSQLQIYCQRNKLKLEYKLLAEKQLKSAKIFSIQITINEIEYITFEHYNKRTAEQKAAQLTLEILNKNG